MKMLEKVKKNGIMKAIIIMTLIGLIVAVIGFAYARYITRLNGTSTADVAKWSFKVNGNTNQNFVIDNK